MKLRIDRKIARVSDIGFIDRDAAAWLAVTAIITAKTVDADFDRLFLGMMGAKARERFLQTGYVDSSWPSPGVPLLALERDVRYAIRQSVRGEGRVGTAVGTLGYVLHQMLVHGVSKSTALEDSQRFGQKASNYLHDRGRTDEAKAYRGRGSQTVKALWKKYECVLPYVYAITLNQAAQAGGHGKVTYEDLRYMPQIFIKQLEKNSRTRRVELRSLQVIDFK